MYEFLDRLVNIAIPRIRDFRGLNMQFDGNGNFQWELEHVIFPEINFDKVDKIKYGYYICTSAKNNNEAIELLKVLYAF